MGKSPYKRPFSPEMLSDSWAVKGEWPHHCGYLDEKTNPLKRYESHFTAFVLSLSKPGEGNCNPLQYSCLENSMDRGACGLQSMGSQRVGQDWHARGTYIHLFIITLIKFIITFMCFILTMHLHKWNVQLLFSANTNLYIFLKATIKSCFVHEAFPD